MVSESKQNILVTIVNSSEYCTMVKVHVYQPTS